jgi:hypothetical protein
VRARAGMRTIWRSNRGLVLPGRLPYTNGKGHRTPTSLTINGFAAEVHRARAIKEASARHGPSPAADGVFADRLINSPG